MKKYNYVRKTFSWEGKRYTAYGKTEMEALQKMVELKEALKRGEKAINDKTTVDRWFREWIEVYKKPSGITEKSLDMYMQKYNGYIKPVLGSLPLKDIKEIQLQKILNEEAYRFLVQNTEHRDIVINIGTNFFQPGNFIWGKDLSKIHYVL